MKLQSIESTQQKKKKPICFDIDLMWKDKIVIKINFIFDIVSILLYIDMRH